MQDFVNYQVCTVQFTGSWKLGPHLCSGDNMQPASRWPRRAPGGDCSFTAKTKTTTTNQDRHRLDLLRNHMQSSNWAPTRHARSRVPHPRCLPAGTSRSPFATTHYRCPPSSDLDCCWDGALARRGGKMDPNLLNVGQIEGKLIRPPLVVHRTRCLDQSRADTVALEKS